MPPILAQVGAAMQHLLTTAAEASLDDERDAALALREDREGIGAAATELDGTALLSAPREPPPRG